MDYFDDDGNLINGEWRNGVANGCGLQDLDGKFSSHNFGLAAERARELFMKYFLTEEGGIPWQIDVVRRGMH